MQRLNHKTALVINAGDPVGKVVAERLGALGAKVILHHEDTGCEISQTLSTIKAMGSRAVEIKHDLRSSVKIKDFFGTLIISHPVIDILIINGSMSNEGTESRDADRKNLLEIFSSGSALINERGHIIYLSPIIRQILQTGMPRELSKDLSTAILAHSRTIGKKKAVFNTIIPYGLNQDILQQNPEAGSDHIHFSVHNTLLKRYTELDDLANLTEFLASDLSAVISGQYFLTNI
ncbi:SDR family oxidoreductase [Pedobacter sp. ISL-68]|uniref:SDR family oxidoreductase n=1 Tax=unclassified Pedobacter TaxID=2628915 RepID=UPI001BE579BB|nr:MULTISPECIES: SDR family oxidoreductase [unclassified Pedobacter]MBT2560245.1 SDR family oxidoreductase [Pedobacter sp. ISL-64]MBT2589225.1 SDR family oxidoreductase [Pedobacter sp. ISL-68]